MDKDPTFEELKFQCYVYYIVMFVFMVQPELFSKIILAPPEDTALSLSSGVGVGNDSD